MTTNNKNSSMTTLSGKTRTRSMTMMERIRRFVGAPGLLGAIQENQVARALSTCVGFPAATPAEQLARCQAMAALNPSGFRRPEKPLRTKNGRTRGDRNREAHARHVAAVRQEQREQYMSLHGTPHERPVSSFGSLASQL